MFDSKVLLASTASFLRKASGQVVTSVAAALCVAAITNAMTRKDAPPAPIVVVAPAPAPPSTPVQAPTSAFSIGGALPVAMDLSHGFPMDGDPGFQTSLSRPFVALAGEAWLDMRVVTAHEAPAATRKPQTKVVVARPAKPAPTAMAAVEPAPAAQPGPEAAGDTGTRILGFRTPRLLPSMGDVVGGATAMAASLTRLARFE